MHEFTPGEVAGHPVFILPLLADAGFHFRFEIVHRLPHSIAEGIENPLVAGDAVEQRNALRHMEIEIVSDRAIVFNARRELLAGLRMQIVAECIP